MICSLSYRFSCSLLISALFPYSYIISLCSLTLPLSSLLSLLPLCLRAILLSFSEYLCSPPSFSFFCLLPVNRRCLALALSVFAQLVLLLSPSPVSYLSQHHQSGCRSTDNPPACCELILDKPCFLSVSETGLRCCLDDLLHQPLLWRKTHFAGGSKVALQM